MSTQEPGEVMSGIKLADLKRDIEALLFASGDPLSVDTILTVMGANDTTARRVVEQILDELSREFPEEGERGFELVQLAGGWAFRTNARSQGSVEALFEIPSEVGRLSPAAMECLAIVAYLQPVTRPQLADVRGVNSDSPVHNLLDRELIEEVGRTQAKGGAVLYGTTRRFEAMFGLGGLKDLPALEDFELSDDAKADLKRRLGLLTVPE